MTKVKDIQNTSSIATDLDEIKITNRLFLDLLYNLSKYPHAQKPKKLVREGLFAFEEEHVIRTLKAKK